jgi:ABC-type uncharacterized transport system involved in gliding motility auxiliary subunit/ABC-type transport system involved in multi-copper enzyme maturation permease subunit
MKAILTVARRELRAMFDHPTGYVLLIVFLALNNYLFLRQAFLIGVASVRPMLELWPWLLLFFIPAVTMRALAEDVRSGTIEVVLAQPISELQLLLGKFLGQVSFIWIGMALTIPIPLGLSLGADLPAGVVFAQYFGAALLAGAFSAMGIWSSSLVRNQITAFIVGVAVMFAFVLIGFTPVLTGLPVALSNVLSRLAVLPHFANIARGVIDLRDLVYFVSLAAVFIVMAYGALMSRKLAPRGPALVRLRLGTLLLILTVVVVNLFGRHIRGRIDLTPGKAYTLSPATKAILAALPDLVTIRLYVSKDVPPEVTLEKRNVDDLLADIRAAGDGMVRLVVLDPSEDEAIVEEAESFGVPAVQWSASRESEFQIKEGYFGLAVQFADQSEAIPAIIGTSDLEYRLVSFIRSLTRDTRTTVGIHVATAGAPQDAPVFSGVEGLLRENFDVRPVLLETDTLDPDEMPVLMLADTPLALADSVAEKLADYLDAGGSALIMVRGMATQAVRDQMIGVERPVAWNRLLQPYGLFIQPDMVFDLASNHPVSMRGQFGTVLRSYPFWLRTISTQASPINRDVGSVFLPWSSSIDTSGARAGTVTPLLVTSDNSGAEQGNAFISPQRTDYTRGPLASRLVAVQVNPADAVAGEGDSAAAPLPAGRLVVVGSDDFASDQWVRSMPVNASFVLNAVDWLAQEEGLISIRAKDRTPPALVFESDGVRDLVQFGNAIGVPLLLALLGAVRLLRRRRMTRRSYVPTVEAA